VLPGKSSGPVLVYGRENCGLCQSAKKYLKEKGIPFVFKDIDKDSGAKSEMWSKSGMKSGSIRLPLTDWGGKINIGWNRAEYDQLSRDFGKAAGNGSISSGDSTKDPD
jgi:glutaredoxin